MGLKRLYARPYVKSTSTPKSRKLVLDHFSKIIAEKKRSFRIQIENSVSNILRGMLWSFARLYLLARNPSLEQKSFYILQVSTQNLNSS